ncbi:MAG TPA: prolipoprotein diacylglyceryl transferase [Thermomicrobiaceae bacterium]|nr:prolipoprotein diacylglyceryl transferase [Thermomicrobiaceae bacterium]
MLTIHAGLIALAGVLSLTGKSLVLSIPSPPANGFWIGPLFIHAYGMMYAVGIIVSVLIIRHRWQAMGGDPSLVEQLAPPIFIAGVIGARIYFDVTTPAVMPHTWWGPFAVWDGGLGIWGGVALALVVGIWLLRRRGIPVGPFMDAVAPGLLVAQAIGRIGNYFNQELFGKPTSLPWGLQIAPQFRPAGFAQYATFQPTFLYELIFDLAWAGILILLGRTGRVRAPGLFALYVAGYSAFRVFEESLRIDYSQYFFGLRLNFFVAGGMTLVGLAWFAYIQLHGRAGSPALVAEEVETEAAS